MFSVLILKMPNYVWKDYLTLQGINNRPIKLVIYSATIIPGLTKNVAKYCYITVHCCAFW